MVKLVCGRGINDAGHSVVTVVEYPKINGNRVQKQVWRCPYYNKWSGMLSRCYSVKRFNLRQDYEGCGVSEDWLLFSSFIKWVDSQPNRNWQNCELDKDLLFKGNKLYSQESCVFITKDVNIFLSTRRASRGKYMIGVSWHKENKMFRSTCNNPFNKKSEHVGYFESELEAHKAWQSKKHEYAHQLADLQDDPRVADALRQRYTPDKDWTEC